MEKTYLVSCLAALCLAAGGCGPAQSAQAVQPDALTAKQAMGDSQQDAVCRAPGSRGTPLVVDWPAQDRMDLEAAMHDGVAVVRYECGKIELLSVCHAPGSYGFLGLTPRAEVIRLGNVDEIRANLPLQGAALVANLGAEIERGQVLDLAVMFAGKQRTTVATATKAQIVGDCAGATHFVRGAFVGAFAMSSGTKGRVRVAAEIFSSGVTSNSEAQRSAERRDGDPNACSGVKSGDDKLPQGCSAAIRLELVGLGTGDAASQPATPAVPAELEAQMACPDGMVASGGKCTSDRAAPYRCSGASTDECKTQCEAGDVESCAILASMHEAARNYDSAVGLHERACSAGLAFSCSRLGVMFFYGSSVKKDTDKAAKLFTLACEAGDADGCNNLGAVLDMGTGIQRDRTRGAALFVAACNAGDAQACFNAAVSYRDGRGVTPDPARAATYLERAKAGGIVALFERGCSGGQAYTCWGLGYMMQHGLFVARDVPKARQLFERSCPAVQWACESLTGLGAAKP